MKHLFVVCLLLASSGVIALLWAAEKAQSAERLFVQAREASGGKAWDDVRSVVGAGTETSSGMTGNWREVDDLRLPRLMQLEDAGLVRYLHVWNGPEHWRQKFSGGVHALNSDFGRENAITDEWLAQRCYIKPDGGGAKLSAVTRRTNGRMAFDVVTATPKDGQPVELWFNVKDHLLVRTVRQQNLNIEIIRYSDYRKAGRVKLPYVITADDGDVSSLDTIRVSSYKLNAATAADFEKPRPPGDSKIDGGKTTVPFVFEGDIIVQAKINGKGPFGFILDTGGHDILTPDAVKAIGLKAEGAGRSGGAGEGKVSEQYARVERMDIGGMVMRNQVFTVIPLTYATVEQGRRPPLAGILGLEIFERFVVRIDYRTQTLTLESPASYTHTGSGTAVPIFFNDDEPLIKGKLDGHTGDFGVDTGNAGSLVVQGHWAHREGITARLKSGLEVVSFGMGGMTHNWASRVDLELAGTELRHVIGRLATDKAGAFASVVEAANIGNDILAHFTVTFDYARGQLWFEVAPGFAPQPFSRAGLGASKDRLDALTVVNVSQNTPATDAGLQVGDEIRSVDGVPTSQMSGYDFLRATRKAPGTKVDLSVVRKGEPLDITLVLRELLP